MQDTHALPAWTVWGKPLTGGRYALTAINTLETEPAVISIELSDLGLGGGVPVVETDVWTGLARPLSGAVWKIALPKGAGSHRFVILGPRESEHL
jgi:hypothetical protein